MFPFFAIGNPGVLAGDDFGMGGDESSSGKKGKESGIEVEWTHGV